MKRYDLITPEGTRDLLFEGCLARRMVEDRLSKLFEGFGYSEVVTPGIEFYDLFMGSSRNFQQESLYKLTDSKGRLIVMRPDSTIPIARLASTRLKGAKLPLRLYYNQSIFENNSLLKGRSDEVVQAGIELIGGENSKRADYEAGRHAAGRGCGRCGKGLPQVPAQSQEGARGGEVPASQEGRGESEVSFSPFGQSSAYFLLTHSGMNGSR